MEVISYVQAGNMESLKGWLEEHPDPDGSMLTFGGVSVMHWAASSNTEILQFLLERLPFLRDARDMSDGATPLHWAAQEGMDTNVSLLLAAGAQIFPDSNGETALHSACMNGHLSSAKLVTQHFGPTLVNSVSLEGNTPLHLATLNNHARVIAFLLKNGANPNTVNRSRQTPIMIAQSKNDKQLLEYFDPDKMVLNEQISDLEGQLTSLQDRLKQAEEKAESESLKNFQLFKQLKAVEDAKSESDQRVDNLTVQLLASHEINEKQTQTIQQLEIALQQAQQRIQEVQLQSEEANSEAVKALESQHARANIFQNEYAYRQLMDTNRSLQTLQKLLEDVSHAVLDSKTNLRNLENAFHL